MRFGTFAILTAVGVLTGTPQQPAPVEAHVETIATFPFRATDMAVSPNGRFFYLVASDSLLAYDRDRKTITVMVRTPCAGSNCARVAVSPTGDAVAVKYGFDTKANMWGLWTMAVNPTTGLPTSGLRLVSRRPGGQAPSYSPDGKTLAINMNTGIAIFPADSGSVNSPADERIVATGQSQAPEGAPPQWSPDGKWIYAAWPAPGGEVLERVPAHGGLPEVMTQVVQYAAPGPSPDGGFLVVESLPPQTQRGVGTVFSILDTAGRQVSTVTLTGPQPSGYAWGAAEGWMFKGLHYAMVVPDVADPRNKSDSERTRLVDVDLGTGLGAGVAQAGPAKPNVGAGGLGALGRQPAPVDARVQAVASFPFTVTDVAVSPSGKLFYLATPESLLVYDRDRKTIALVAAGQYGNVTVSPTGDRIADHQGLRTDTTGTGGFWTMPVDRATGLATGAPTRMRVPQLSGAPGLGTSALRFSPDGRMLAFIERGPGNGQIGVVPVDSGAVRTVVSGIFMPPIAWSPDGKWLYAGTQGIQGVMEGIVVRLPAEGGRPQTMTLPSPQGGRSWPSWQGVAGLSPDGAFIVVHSEQFFQATNTMRAPASVKAGTRVPLADGQVAVVREDRTLQVPVGGGNAVALRAAGYVLAPARYIEQFAVYDTARAVVSTLRLTLPPPPFDFTKPTPTAHWAWMGKGLHLAMALPDTLSGWTRLIDVDLGSGLNATRPPGGRR